MQFLKVVMYVCTDIDSLNKYSEIDYISLRDGYFAFCSIVVKLLRTESSRHPSF